MSVARFERALKQEILGSADRKWFLIWLKSYAGFHRQNEAECVSVDREQTVRFLVHLKNRGKRAWQRLQVVAALELYRKVVLGCEEPSLGDLRARLSSLVAKERAEFVGRAEGAATLEDWVGTIDESEPQVVQNSRKSLRIRHYSRRTERAYTQWVMRFMKHCRTEDLAAIGEPEITEFLGDLAVRGNVTASTQNQAFNALLYAYRHVLGKQLASIDAVRAKQPRRPPWTGSISAAERCCIRRR